MHFHDKPPFDVSVSLPAQINFEKDAGLKKWLKDIIDRRRKRKSLNIIKTQAKNKKTVKFNYTNLKNETRIREIEPYEIRDGYLWGFDRSSPNSNIKKYFMSKLKNVKPGETQFKPRWEVKIANLNEKVAGRLSRVLRNPKFLRFIEPAIGGTMLGGIGYGTTAGEPETSRVTAAIAGATGGIIGAKILSKSIRHNKLVQAIKRSQERLWQRRSDIIRPRYLDPLGNVKRSAGKIRRPVTIKGLRKEVDTVFKNPKTIEEYRKSLIPSAQSRLLAPYLKPFLGTLREVEPQQMKMFFRGYYGKPRGYRLSKGMEGMYVAGKNFRAAVLSPNQSIIDNMTREWTNDRIYLANKLIARDNKKYLERIKKITERKLFGTL